MLKRLRDLSEEAEAQKEARRLLVGPYEHLARQLAGDASELETKIVRHADEPMVNKVSEGVATIGYGAEGIAVGLKDEDAAAIKSSEEEIIAAAQALARVGERYGLSACVLVADGAKSE
jgi:hypothetical protein